MQGIRLALRSRKHVESLGKRSELRPADCQNLSRPPQCPHRPPIPRTRTGSMGQIENSGLEIIEGIRRRKSDIGLAAERANGPALRGP